MPCRHRVSRQLCRCRAARPVQDCRPASLRSNRNGTNAFQAGQKKRLGRHAAMQFRHLRYFVKVVEAGSFSRAAAEIHVAQPALSQQIGELEERLGFVLLERSSRGVRPTAAGEIVFSEATEILRQLEQLPGIVRSSSGDVEGIVHFGMTVAIAGHLAGPAVAACKQALPKVALKFSDADSDVLQARIEAQTLDMAVVFEDHFIPNFSRHPLYRQRLYLVTNKPLAEHRGAIPLDRVAKLPLVLPPLPKHRRIVI